MYCNLLICVFSCVLRVCASLLGAVGVGYSDTEEPDPVTVSA